MSKLSWLGIGATGVYALGLILLIMTNWASFKMLEPNAWGDFLAGSLGPLGIFWLVLGYFQQGTELRNSVEALRLQTEELNQSVQQQKALVSISEKQHTFELEERQRQAQSEEEKALPSFIVFSAGGSSGGSRDASGNRLVSNKFKLRNSGADAKYITWKTSLNDRVPNKLGDFPSGRERDIVIEDPKWARDWDSATLTIVSTSVNGVSRTQEFLISEETVPETTTKSE